MLPLVFSFFSKCFHLFSNLLCPNPQPSCAAGAQPLLNEQIKEQTGSNKAVFAAPCVSCRLLPGMTFYSAWAGSKQRQVLLLPARNFVCWSRDNTVRPANWGKKGFCFFFCFVSFFLVLSFRRKRSRRAPLFFMSRRV